MEDTVKEREIYLLDVKRHREFSFRFGGYISTLIVRLARTNNRQFDGDRASIPVKDLLQIDATLKEPITAGDLAQALEGIAAKIRKSVT